VCVCVRERERGEKERFYFLTKRKKKERKKLAFMGMCVWVLGIELVWVISELDVAVDRKNRIRKYKV
jgi:hypothetical protein